MLLSMLIRRQRGVAFLQPAQVRLVVRVSGVEWDEGVVGEADDGLTSTKSRINKLIHGRHNSELAEILPVESIKVLALPVVKPLVALT